MFSLEGDKRHGKTVVIRYHISVIHQMDILDGHYVKSRRYIYGCRL
jgi:hypothetical protein